MGDKTLCAVSILVCGAATVVLMTGEGGMNPRNVACGWTVVKAIVTNPHFKVQWIFTDRSHINAMLRYAQKQGESNSVIKRASRVLNVEKGHSDHFHVRIYK